MSTNSTTTASQAGSGRISGRLAAALKSLWTAFIAWRQRQAALAHLQAMSDRELRDIGLSRSQIECAVTGERARDRVGRHY